MFEWMDVSDIDRLREHKEALKMERRAGAGCDKERSRLVAKMMKIKRLLERFDAGAD